MSADFTGIDRIKIENYKSIQNGSLDIAPITVLAGANSTGKSSMLQPLLLMKQTLDAVQHHPLFLPGPNVSLSSLSQVRPRFIHKENSLLSITVENKKVSATSIFSSEAKEVIIERSCFKQKQPAIPDEEICLSKGCTADYLLNVANKIYGQHVPVQVLNKIKFALFPDRCFYSVAPIVQSLGFPSHFICPDIQGIIHLPGLRGNPQSSYVPQSLEMHPYYAGLFQFYTASLIERWTKNGAYKAKYQKLIEYLSMLNLAAGVSTRRVNNSCLEILVGWHQSNSPSLENGKKDKDMVNITDVGVGVSQALPILVALLTAEPNQIVYIEQPGIHLHPFAQQGLVNVIVDAALRGVKVIVETHSATFLLALQTAIAEHLYGLTHEQVAMYWFSRVLNGSTKIEKAEIQKDGTYGTWPVDFAPVNMELHIRFAKAAEKAWKEQGDSI